MLLRVYFIIHAKAFLEMKQRHNHAFQKHISKGITLVIFTVFAIVLKIFEKFAFAAWRSCVDEERLECEAINTAFSFAVDCKNLYKHTVYWRKETSIC